MSSSNTSTTTSQLQKLDVKLSPGFDNQVDFQIEIDDSNSTNANNGLVLYHDISGSDVRTVGLFFVKQSANQGSWTLLASAGRNVLGRKTITAGRSAKFTLGISADGKNITIALSSGQKESISLSESVYPTKDLEAYVQIAPQSKVKITELSYLEFPILEFPIYQYSLASTDTSKLTPPYISVDNVDQLVELRAIAVPKLIFGGLAISPDSKLLATGGCERIDSRFLLGGLVKVFDIETGQEVLHPDASQTCVESVAFSPDGTTLAFAFPAEIRLWDIVNRQFIGRIEEEGSSGFDAWKAFFSPNGKLLVHWGANPHGVRLWDPVTRKRVSHLVPSSLIRDVALSSNGAMLAWTAPATASLWDMRNARIVRQMKTGADYALISFSPDNRLLAVVACTPGATGRCEKGEYISLVDVGNGIEVRRLGEDLEIPLRMDSMNSRMTFSADGTLLATTDRGFRARVLIWDINAGKLARQLDKGGDRIVFSPDGRFLITTISTEPVARIYGLN